MAKQEGVIVQGTVVEHIHDKFKVELENGVIVTGYLSGNLRKNFIKILLQDKVKIELSIFDLSQGRIIYRESTNAPRSE